jgi:hypothetical protein
MHVNDVAGTASQPSHNVHGPGLAASIMCILLFVTNKVHSSN